MDDLFNFSITDWRGAIAGSSVTIILGAIGYIWTQLTELRHNFVARNLWKPFLSNPRETSVVLTTKDSNRKSGTQKVSLSEVQAFSELRSTLSRLKIDTNLVQDPDADLAKLSGKHIISIGGPKNNNVTREILALAANKYRIPFFYDETRECLQEGNNQFLSEEAQDGTLLKDYGFVIRVTGLNGNGKISYLVAFGLRGRGTWGAVKALTADDKLMLKIDSYVGKNDFAMLIEFNFNHNLLIGTKILAANALIPVI
ncbi:hypothetical protein [Ferribacterium limneticum]|uniref:hypothetical protein n=1 Tax=Ferribacterium limneticum TaxID=76259 RepID=UPI001CF8CCEA|nr:hypothetical protein [Ferribacterium limneticum]UCV24127.1 hypothetical protein KI613_06300 [Ferribacterium limneticum]